MQVLVAVLVLGARFQVIGGITAGNAQQNHLAFLLIIAKMDAEGAIRKHARTRLFVNRQAAARTVKDILRKISAGKLHLRKTEQIEGKHNSWGHAAAEGKAS